MKKLILTLMLIATAISSVRATPIYSDNFDYTAGSLVTNSGGNWISISGGGNAGTMMVTTNSMLLVSGNRAEDTEHEFGTLYTTNGSTANLYASFTLKLAGLLPTAVGAYLCHFTGTNVFGNNGFRCRVFLSISNSTHTLLPDGQAWLAISASNQGNTNDGVLINTNTLYTIVTRYVLSNGMSTMWINPTLESDSSITSSEILPPEGQIPALITNGILNISSFGFRQASGEGTEDQIDSLKIGTTFADVIGGNAAPSITGIPAQSIPMNGVAGPLNFTIGDDGGVGGLTLSNATSNAGLIPAGNIVFGGSGASRTVTVTPLTGQQGTATITIFVRDDVNISSISFLVTVGAPTISTIPNLITYSNLPPVSTTVTVDDAETLASSVTISNSFTNPSLISSVVVTGSGATRTITVTPVAGQTGVSVITIYGRDPSDNLVQASFTVAVSPRLGVLLSDTFSYTDFSFTTPNSLDGADGSIWHNAGAVADAGQMQNTNGVAFITSSNAEDVAAPLVNPSAPFASTNGVLFYASFTINMANLPTQAGDYFAHFKDTQSGSTFRDKIYVTKTNTVATDTFRVGVANAANTVSVTYPMDLSTNVTYTVVTRYNSATAESVLWLNPVDETSPSVTATDPSSGSTIGYYGLRESNGEGTIGFDNLLVGTAFTDVAPAGSLVHLNTTGGTTTVTWGTLFNPGAFYLLSSTNVLGPYRYTTNAGAPATSPYTVTPTAPSQFYRTVNVAP